MICVIPKFDHITPLVRLHWLPVYFRIMFKILLLVFKALQGKAPVYIRNLLESKVERSYTLRSDNQRLLQVPETKCKSFGDLAFAQSCPLLWNAPPLELRLISNIGCFKRHLRTYLFKAAFRSEQLFISLY